MDGERAFNMIAGMILASKSDHATKTELLKWLRLAESRTIDRDEESAGDPRGGPGDE